jgi:hypothetical protein
MYQFLPFDGDILKEDKRKIDKRNIIFHIYIFCKGRNEILAKH